MELKETIRRRRSIRQYTGEPISEEALNQILQAALLAPTSMNRKPCRFYVVKDKDVLKKLADAKKAGGKLLADCDAAVVTVGDSEKADTWIEDCSIAMSFMMLAAVDQGIGSCWVQIYLRKQEDGSDAEDAVREILSLKETDRIAGILALGIPAKEAEPYTEADADMGKVIRIG